jgi:hypothetical protein
VTNTATVLPTATEDDTIGGVDETPTPDPDDPDDVTGLPSTGGGPDQTQTGFSWSLIAILVLFAGAAGKYGIAWARGRPPLE